MPRTVPFMNKMSIIHAGLALLLLIAPAGAIGSSASPVPQSVGSLQLDHVESGEEAREAINKLHGKTLPFLQGYVATYGKGRRAATLWISIFESDKIAKEELDKMAGKLKDSKGGVFQHFQKLFVEGIPVYMVTGMGQAHYFFQKGKQGLWIAVDPSEPRQVIRDLVTELP